MTRDINLKKNASKPSELCEQNPTEVLKALVVRMEMMAAVVMGNAGCNYEPGRA